MNPIRFCLSKLNSFEVWQNNKLYLRRYYIYPTNRRSDLDGARFSIKIHEICQSDEDRATHRHPWMFASLILKGSYEEELEEGRIKKFRPGKINFKPARQFHRLHLKTDKVWTLVITGKRKREWGFFVPWEEYLKEHK